MKQFVRSVPAVLFLSVASLSLIALAGCGSSTSPSGPMAAKNLYVVQYSFNNTTNTEQDSVAVFSASAPTGSTTPTSTLMLPSSFDIYSLAVGPQGQIYVGGYQNGSGNIPNSNLQYGEILEYAAGASGSATPTVTLNGSSAETTTFTYPDEMAVNSAGTLFVSSDDGSLEAFPSGFTASSAPTQYLNWGQTNLDCTGDYIGVDTAGGIFYLDQCNDQVDVFAAGAMGATEPSLITGTNTTSFSQLESIAVDGAGDVYVANYNFADDTFDTTNTEIRAANKSVHATGPRRARQLTAYPHTPELPTEPTGIIEFAAGATGAATPMKRIGGAGLTTPNLTGIIEPEALAVDAASNLYYADANGGYDSDTSLLLLEVFPSSANGNVAPATSVTSPGVIDENSGSVAVR
jgi:hypothetical protein